MDYGVINETDGNQIQTGDYAVIQFTRDNTLAAGTQAVTGLGFKPKLLHFYANVSGEPAASVGWSNGSTHRTLWNNHAETANDWQTSTPICLQMRFPSGSTASRITTVTLDADGFTATWTKTGSPTGTTNATCVAFK
jgi:hypothetical protein